VSVPTSRTWDKAPNDIDSGLLHLTQNCLACLLADQPPSASMRDAWDRFYRTYDPVIRSFAASCGASGVELDDCIQEVWTTLVIHLRDFQHDPQSGRFSTWLFAVVRSKASDLARFHTRHPTASLTQTPEVEMRGPGGDPVAAYEARRQQALVHGVLDELREQVSERNFRVLYLHSIEGRTVSETAATLNLTPKQVRSLHWRTKQQFRHLLEWCTRYRPAKR
jgi:RNA polymerase sigma factor (sigma-70 family)